jgi:Ca2+-transporting ATPase
MVGVVLVNFHHSDLSHAVGEMFFKTVPLEFNLWIKIIGFTFSVVIFSEVITTNNETLAKKRFKDHN